MNRSLNSVINNSYVFGSLNENFTYNLRSYLDDEATSQWALGTFVLIAKKFILAFFKLDLEWFRELYLGETEMDIQTLIGMSMPILILFGIGLLIAFFTPICGFIFCCCRFCGKCGSKLTVVRAREQAKFCGLLNLIFLMVAIVLLTVGAGGFYTVGGRLTQVVGHVVNVADYTISDVITFKDELFDDLLRIGVHDVNFVSDHLEEEFNTMDHQVTAPLFEGSIGAAYDSASAIANTFSDSYSALDTAVTEVSTNLPTAITTISANIATQYATFVSMLNDLHTRCSAASAPASVCSGLPDSGTVPAAPDFSSEVTSSTHVSDFQDVLDAVAAFANIGDMIDDMLHSHLPEMISNNTEGVRYLAVEVLREVATIVEPMLLETRDSFANMSDNLDRRRERLNDVSESLEPRLKLVAYVFMGISSVVLLLVVFDLFGVLLGLGTCRLDRPEARGKIGSIASHCLMLSACFSLLFIFIYMAVGSILFIIGSGMTAVCDPVRDLRIFSEVLDDPGMWDGDYILGRSLLNNGSIPLTMEDIMHECQNNTAAYTALKIRHRVDIKEMVNLDEKLPDLEPMRDGVRASVSGFQLLDSTASTTLTNLAATFAHASSSSAQTQAANLDALVNQIDFSSFIATLNSLAADTDPDNAAFANDIRSTATFAQNIMSGSATEMRSLVDRLTSYVDDLDPTLSTLLTSAGQLPPATNAFDTLMASQGADLLSEALTDFILRIVSYGHQLVEHVDDRLANDMARCGLVWDVYDGFTGIICVYFLDAFNGLWLSLCTIGFAFLFNIWFGIRLSKYFKRPIDCHDYTRRNEMTPRFYKFPDPSRAPNALAHSPQRYLFENSDNT